MLRPSKAADYPRANRARRHRAFARSRMFAVLTVILLLAGERRGFAADPQTLSEYQIKAGFLFNFTRFVEWPAKAFANDRSPIVVCTTGDSEVTELLTEAAAGKVVDGRAVLIRHIKVTEDLRECNLLFVTGAEERRMVWILDRVKGTNVLTVGEFPGFAKAGGMINFFIQENKVKLEINLDAATHADMKISAKLIAVSRLVSHNPATGGH
jgi:hypothetical protein